jgi:predicted PurR-regulated permease PerM
MGLWPVAVLTSIYVGIQLFGFAGVVKGPLGFVLVYQIYKSVMA